MKIFPLLFTALAVVTVFGSTNPALAAASEPAYRLTPAVALASAKSVIVNEVLWKCGPSGCSAAQANSRPAIVCIQAARKIGKLESFTANGTAFDEAALAACNAKAK
ncbi:MAG: CC_3452 family protein [Sphingomonadaceae bacterium]